MRFFLLMSVYLGVYPWQPQLLLLERLQDVVRDDALHLVELGGELELLDERGDDHGGGGAADAGLAVEHDGGRRGRVLQQGQDLRKMGTQRFKT